MTVQVFFPLDTANGYANVGENNSAGDAVATGTGVINNEYVANRDQSYNSQDTSDQLRFLTGTFTDEGSNDWTLEIWAGIPADGTTNTVLSSPNNYVLFDYTGVSSQRLYMRDDAGTVYTSTNSFSAVSYTMYHWCAMREGNTLYLMFNGTQVGTHDVTGQTFDFDQGEYWALRRVNDSFNGTDGSVSELRFTSGEAVYDTSGYTPPTEPLAGGASATGKRRSFF